MDVRRVDTRVELGDLRVASFTCSVPVARATGSASATLAPSVPESNSMDAATMLLELHERGNHVV